jgi:eukaryotic-like serine/threonine-protein kinase
VVYKTHGMAHRSWLSPDRKWVLVSEMVDAGWLPCRVVPFDGTSPGQIASPAAATCTYAGWSPDGTWMYFSADATDGFHIWRQHFAKGAPEQLTFGPTEEEGIAVATDGRSLVTSAGIEQSSVWLHDTQGDRQISSEGFATLPSLEYGSSSIRSIFSPDGKTLFYLVRNESARAFKSGELWAAGLDSNRTKPVLPGISMNDFDISPDGDIAFAFPDVQGTSRLWLAPLDRGRPPQLLTSNEADQPRFGPAGDVFFRVKEGRSYSVYSIGRDRTNSRKVISDFVPSFRGVSPDARWLLGLSPLHGEQPVALMALPTQGGLPVRICDFCDVGWGPGGERFYLRLRGIGTMAGGKLFVITLPFGESLPKLPASGIKSEEDVKGLKVAAVIDMTGKLLFAPGPAPSTYAYTRTTVQRNLFRIPLN